MPVPPKKNEKKQDYINRCVKFLIEKENKKPDQARAQCENMWNEDKKKKKGKADIKLFDFGPDLDFYA